METTIDDSIRLLEHYHEWEKQYGMYGSGVDYASHKLVEVAKKYQKIQEIVEHWACCGNPSDSMIAISEVIEDGNDKRRVKRTL